MIQGAPIPTRIDVPFVRDLPSTTTPTPIPPQNDNFQYFWFFMFLILFFFLTGGYFLHNRWYQSRKSAPVQSAVVAADAAPPVDRVGAAPPPQSTDVPVQPNEMSLPSLDVTNELIEMGPLTARGVLAIQPDEGSGAGSMAAEEQQLPGAEDRGQVPADLDVPDAPAANMQPAVRQGRGGARLPPMPAQAAQAGVPHQSEESPAARNPV